MLDETKQNSGDTSQATADSSKEGDGSTSKVENPTFTKEQLDKAVNDALSKVGRDAKALSEQKAKLESEKADLTAKQMAWQKRQEEAEEEAVADDMPALTALRARRQKKADDEAKITELTEREAKLAAREVELAEIIERDGIRKRTELAAKVAAEKGVSVEDILELAKADSREEYERVASKLPKVKEPHVLVVDSGRNRGVSGSLEGLSPAERVKKRDELIKSGKK